MKKKYSLLAVFSLVASVALINPQMTFAAADALDSSGGAKIELGGEEGDAGYFSYQPSPQVEVAGSTSGEAFIVAAAHTGAFNKANGTAYAMSSAASGLYSQNLKGETGIPAVEIDDVEDKKGQLNGTGYLLEGKTAATTTTP
ncbi:MAG: hypothetical protein RBT36_00015 [Desulfobulbus sp.]|jgi:hypothetical protein|nr:hypothetical protein [Desulfobulbus sp.]